MVKIDYSKAVDCNDTNLVDRFYSMTAGCDFSYVTSVDYCTVTFYVNVPEEDAVILLLAIPNLKVVHHD